MRTSQIVGLSASIAFAMLVGCSGVNPQTATVIGPAPASDPQTVGNSGGFVNPKASSTPLIFVTDERKNLVNIYLQAGTNQKKIAEITHLHRPLGITTDSGGNVYVPYKQKIRVYALPYTNAPILTLDDYGNFPYNVAVSRLGLVGVVNICKAPSCASDSASVTFFEKNATKPCVTVAAPSFPLLQFASFDHKGNLYVRGRNSMDGQALGEVTGGCKATAVRALSTTNTIGADGGLKVDKAGRVAVLDSSGSNYFIDTYNPPVSGSLGSPVSTTPLMGLQGPFDFAFLKSGTDLYVDDFLGATTNEYAYPGGGAPENMIADPHGLPSDVAVTPPLVP